MYIANILILFSLIIFLLIVFLRFIIIKNFKLNKIDILNKLAHLQYNRLNDWNSGDLNFVKIFNSDMCETIYKSIDKIA
jgi:hypothetical protein